MVRKIFLIVAFMLCCCNGVVLNAQYSTRGFLEGPSSIGGVSVDESLVRHEMESSYGNGSFVPTNEVIDLKCYCEVWGLVNGEIVVDHYEECEVQGSAAKPTCEANGAHSADPGTVPVGDSYYFWIVAAFLYGLRCFYNRKRRIKAV